MPAAGPVLTRRQLNRALLARQMLLRREPVSVETAVERLVGLQGQTPLAPYVALWSRLEPFDPEVLSGLLDSRRAVRIGLMRTTIHLVTTEDALALRPVMQPALDRTWASSGFRKRLAGIDMDALLLESRRLLEERPRGPAELGAELAARWPDYDRDSLAYASRFLLPLVQVPPRGLWNRTGAARHTTLEAWAGEPMSTDAAPDTAVLRYLAAFGPATVADMRIWCWLAGLREAFERLRPGLRTFRDERGRELFDVPDGPLPDPDTPAPPRFLPDYDNLVLSHDDRSRIVPPEANQRVTWDWGALLVDGFVRGTWKVVRARDEAALQVKTFEPLAPADQVAVHAEGSRVLEFLAPGSAGGDVRIVTDREQMQGRVR
jgi:hypothetical protein